MPDTRGKDKPVPIPLPHPLYSVEDTEVCLFVKDHKGEGHKESKNKVKAEKIPGIAKVIGISKLKTKYESHEKKRQLCSSYDLFMADDRILPSLPKLIGKTFFKKKKHPIPVKLAGKDWAGQIRKACGCTYLHLKGSSLTVRVAKATQEEAHCVENIMEAIEGWQRRCPPSKLCTSSRSIQLRCRSSKRKSKTFVGCPAFANSAIIMTDPRAQRISDAMREIPDFPKPGIQFFDVRLPPLFLPTPSPSPSLRSPPDSI
jgi:hypothetical protein